MFHKTPVHCGLDQYYTKEDVALQCISCLNINEYDFIIEPSAGDGAFLNQIDHTNKVGIDIEPGSVNIKKQNWFDYMVDAEYDQVLIIGNPPFGRNNELSTRFIAHGLKFQNVKTIAFILPNTYKKHTKQKFLPRTWRIAQIVPIERNSFYFEGEERHIPCSFFVFDKSSGKDLRFMPANHTESPHFYFGTKNDFDLFVFGASPHKITTRPTQNNRGYYLKSKIPVNDLRENIQKIQWEGNSSASGGVFWLTKPEFIYLYNRAMGQLDSRSSIVPNQHYLF